MQRDLLRRIRWGNVGRLAAAVTIVAAVVAWPRVAGPAPRRPVGTSPQRAGGAPERRVTGAPRRPVAAPRRPGRAPRRPVAAPRTPAGPPPPTTAAGEFGFERP